MPRSRAEMQAREARAAEIAVIVERQRLEMLAALAADIAAAIRARGDA
jgi:hypothetical protein